MSKKNVVIIGAGFGGVEAARILGNHHKLFNITIISKQESFLYYPALYQLADRESTPFSVLKVKDMINSSVNFILDEVISIDRKLKKVSFLERPHINYDILIVALGSVTEDFGTPGVREHMYQFRTIDDLDRLRVTVFNYLESNHNEPIIVVGGGPTGVELTAQIATLFKEASFYDTALHPHLMLVEGSPNMVSQLPQKAQIFIKKHLLKLKVALYTNTRVTSYDGKVLKTTNGDFASKTVVWAAGLAASPLLRDLDTETNKVGRVIVNEYLELPTDNNVFVIGDSAATVRSGLAQTAIYDGNFVAKSIIARSLNKKRQVYSAPNVGYAVPVGNRWGVASFGPFIFKGFLGSVLRNIIDFRYLLTRADVKSAKNIIFHKRKY